MPYSDEKNVFSRADLPLLSSHFYSHLFLLTMEHQQHLFCLLDPGSDSLFLQPGGRCHWYLKMDRSGDVSLSSSRAEQWEITSSERDEGVY